MWLQVIIGSWVVGSVYSDVPVSQVEPNATEDASRSVRHSLDFPETDGSVQYVAWEPIEGKSAKTFPLGSAFGTNEKPEIATHNAIGSVPGLSQEHGGRPPVYYTSVPYISGYRMTPIYSEKQVIVKDYATPIPTGGHIGYSGQSGLGHGVAGFGSGLAVPSYGGLSVLPQHGSGLGVFPGLSSGISLLPGYGSGLSHEGHHGGESGLFSYGGSGLGGLSGLASHIGSMGHGSLPSLTHDHGHSSSKSSGWALTHPYDTYFESEISRNSEPQLSSPENYAEAITELQHQIDYIQSLRANALRQTAKDCDNLV